VLIGLISKYGKRVKFTSISEHMKSLPNKSKIIELELNLRKYTTLFLLNEQFMELLKYGDSKYKYYSSPKYTLRFKTSYIRSEGVGKQYLDYIKDILILFDNKSSKQQNEMLANFTDSCINLMNTPLQSKNDVLKKPDFIMKMRKPFIDLFELDIIDRKNYIKTLYYLLFFKKIRYMIGILRLYVTSYYSILELKEIFRFKTTDNFNKLSLIPGKEHISNIWLDNPVWGKPFIQMDEDKYLYPIFTLPLTFIEHMISNMLNENDKDLYNRIKTKQYMEKKIFNILRTKYKQLTIYPNLKFTLNEQTYETDILIIHNNIAMIIEVKGHALSKKGNMGDETRIQNRIEQIIEKSSKQASRLKEIILKRRKHNKFEYDRKKTNLDFSSIDIILTLSISFEWLIFFSTVMNHLRTQYEISEDHIHCSLTEIDIIVDALENPEQMLYYFYKRSLLEKNKYPIKADELDLFCHFLKNGFRFDINSEGYFDIVGEYDRHPISQYLLTKYNLSTQDDDFIEEMKKRNPKQDYISITEFVAKHISFLRKEKCDNIFLTGFFNTIPNKYQKFIESKVIHQFKKLKNKFAISKFLIDHVSPDLILVAMDSSIVNYEYVINQINLNLVKKEKNNCGSIIVLYKSIKSSISIESITFLYSASKS
jgi:hypothetical protein